MRWFLFAVAFVVSFIILNIGAAFIHLPCERTVWRPETPTQNIPGECIYGEWLGTVRTTGTGTDFTALGNILAILVTITVLGLSIAAGRSLGREKI